MNSRNSHEIHLLAVPIAQLLLSIVTKKKIQIFEFGKTISMSWKKSQYLPNGSRMGHKIGEHCGIELFVQIFLFAMQIQIDLFE